MVRLNRYLLYFDDLVNVVAEKQPIQESFSFDLIGVFRRLNCIVIYRRTYFVHVYLYFFNMCGMQRTTHVIM